MDGRGRLAQPLKRTGQSRTAPVRAPRRPRVRAASARPTKFGRLLQRWGTPILQWHSPRGFGTAVATALIIASAGYGADKGGHLPAVTAQLQNLRDAAANAAGFRIASIALAGQKHVSRAEILSLAGVTERASLLLLDAAAARARLETNPWIAHATVLKLYPDRLQIGVIEREAFALWQKDGKLSVIAADGTVLEPYAAQRFGHLPLVVGRGAEIKAPEILALIERHASIRDAVRAAVLIAERRWNLRLKNGIDVRLPETDIEPALARLVALDRDNKLISRDLAVIDLRLPDRVTVRLSDDAALVREETLKQTLKEKKPKRKGGDA